MTRGVIMCGAYVTMKVPVIVAVLGFITLIIGAVATGISENTYCPSHDYYSCDYNRNSLLISGILCILIGVSCLIAALIMYLKVKNAPEPTTPPVAPQTFPVISGGGIFTGSPVLATTTTYPAHTQYPRQYQYPQQQQQQNQYFHQQYPYPQQQPPAYST